MGNRGKKNMHAKVCYGHDFVKGKNKFRIKNFYNFPDLRCLALKFKMRFS